MIIWNWAAHNTAQNKKAKTSDENITSNKTISLSWVYYNQQIYEQWYYIQQILQKHIHITHNKINCQKIDQYRSFWSDPVPTKISVIII